MALGSNHQTTTTGDKFIPEVWADETIAAYKSNLVLSNQVRKMNHRNQRGDTIHIPKPVRGSANTKQANTQVTLQGDTHNELSISIDQHWEYSVMIEDILSVQAQPSLRRFYTDDAGYALAKQVDTDLHSVGKSLNGGNGSDYTSAVIGGDGSTNYDPTANTNTGNGSALTDAGIRQVIQSLDDADVPADMRWFVIPPISKNTLLGLSRFTEQAFTGEAGSNNSIRSGMVGEIYGIPVYVSTNCPTITADDTSTQYRVAMMAHRDAIVHVEQQAIRTQTQYQQQYLGDLFTADTIYGYNEYRDEAGIPMVVPA